MKAYDELKAAVLAQVGICQVGWCVYGRFVASELGIPRDVCNAILRDLRNSGEVIYVRGLMDDDGMLMGSGYQVNPRAQSKSA